MKFIPQIDTGTSPVPYFEDQPKGNGHIPGSGTERTLSQLTKLITGSLSALDASHITFTPGEYAGNPTRYGYQIAFKFNGVPGRIDCAALPLRSFATRKKDRALAQALYLVHLELQSMKNAWIYKPGSMPLIPYLLGPGNQTVTEALVKSGVLPDIHPAGFLPPGETRP